MDEHVKYGWDALKAVGFPLDLPDDFGEKLKALRGSGWEQLIDVGSEFSSRVETFVKDSDCVVIWQYAYGQWSAALIPNDGAALLELLGRILPLLRDADAIRAEGRAQDAMQDMYGLTLPAVHARGLLIAAGYDRDEIESMAATEAREQAFDRARETARTMRKKGETREQFIEAQASYSGLYVHEWAQVWDQTA